MENEITAYIINLSEPKSFFETASQLSSLAISFFSFIVACLAIYLTIHQIRIQRAHNLAMTRPHLMTWSHANAEDNSFSFVLQNNGLGPAIVKSIEVFVGGEMIPGRGPHRVLNAINACFGHIDGKVDFNLYAEGNFIPAKESLEVVNFKAVEKINTDEALHWFLKSTKILIQYEDIQGNKFELDTHIERNIQTQ